MDIRKVILDLRNDIPQEVGCSIPGKFVKRYYGVHEVPLILNCLSEKMNTLKEPEELCKFDVIVFGNISPGIFGQMSVNIYNRDDVESLTYIKPGDAPVKVFPVEFE